MVIVSPHKRFAHFGMSSITNPIEKKKLAYARDHYNRNGESNKAWRRLKPLLKAKARRAYRKAAQDLIRLHAGDDDTAATVTRSVGNLQARRIADWGVIGLRDFVADRLTERASRSGAKQRRRAARS